MMHFAQLKDLVASGESHQLEFKKSTGLLKAAFESLCAFLNTNGGTVLIGVTNNGEIVGQEVTDQIQQTISNEINKLEPPETIDVQYVPLPNSDVYVIVLKVQSNAHKPYVYEGRPFLREQTVTRRMSQQLYDRLVTQRLQLNFSWERMPTQGYSVDDLDHDTIEGVVRKAVETGRMPEEALRQDMPKLLESLDLMNEGQLTNAAIVLFGKKVTPNYPQCHLQLARFKGLDRTEFMDIDQVHGNVFILMEKAMVFVRRHLPIAAKIIPGQLERVETPLIPFNAIREVLYNAFCHRDYTIYGGSIGVAIYDDRMEIFSHGALPVDATIEKIKVGFSKRRNPIIADVFYRCNLIEKWGRGIQKIISSCLEANDPEPEFFADALEFKVTFRFPRSMKPPVYEIGSETSVTKHHLSKRQQEIVMILLKGGDLPSKDILSKLTTLIPERTLRYELSLLKDKGVVDTKGHTHSKTWFVVKDTP